MGLNEQWGGLDSRYAESRVVVGCLVHRKAGVGNEGIATVSPGIVKFKKALGVYHSPSIDLQIGNMLTGAVAEAPDTANLADGFYALYAHPKQDASMYVDDFELRYGNILKQADGATECTTMAQALDGRDVRGAADADLVPNVQVGSEVATVPEPNYDASAFKMASAVPNQDFYKGRSVLLAIVQVTGGDLAAINITKSHRV